MRTKFIIHGGFAGRVNDQNDLFFKEMLRDLPYSPTVLLVYFAKELDRIPVNQAEDVGQFKRNSEGKILTFLVADEGMFAEQVKVADIVYLHGGSPTKLIQILRKFPHLDTLFEGKVVAGESAGAYALSAIFYSKSHGGLFQGLGFVPTQTICHYEGINEDKFQKDSNLETLLLPDYRYRVFYR